MTTATLFCGGGGEEEGKRRAFQELGVRASYAIAINHWTTAVQVHGRNHPHVEVYQEDITQVSAATYGLKHIHLLQASPSCVHHSRARGGLPKQDQERSHAWEVVDRWLMAAKVECFLLENVVEFEDWGPLDEKGNPIRARKGEDFQKFVAALRHLGYQVEWRCLVAADYGDPTTRRRLFLQATLDGRPIVWPKPTHRNPKAKKKQLGLFDGPELPPWRPAAECIDWSRPVPSIFGRKRPLAEATLRRIAAGMDRYTLKGKPFLVNLTHGGRIEELEDPLKTVTTANRGEKALAAPSLIQYHATQAGGRERGQGLADPLQTVDTSNRYALAAAMVTKFQENSIGQELSEPMHTVLAGAARFGVVGAFVAKHYGGVVGTGLNQPLGTVTAIDHHSLVAASMVNMRGTSADQIEASASGVDAPVKTISGGGVHGALVTAGLVQTGYGERVGQAPRALDIEAPLGTVVNGQKHALVAGSLLSYYGTTNVSGVDTPLDTVTTKDRHGLIAASLARVDGVGGLDHDEAPERLPVRLSPTLAFLVEYLEEPDLVTVEIDGVLWPVVEVGDDVYVIYDIGLRMLEPRELARAMGFPESFSFERLDGRPLTKAEQVKIIGNACPVGTVSALIKAMVEPRLADWFGEAA